MLSAQGVIRREKLARLREMGINPYLADLFPVNFTAAQVEPEYEEGKKYAFMLDLLGVKK